MKSQLAKYQIIDPKTDEEIYRIKRNAWRDEKMLILNRAQIESLPPFNQVEIEAIAIQFYGKKGKV